MLPEVVAMAESEGVLNPPEDLVIMALLSRRPARLMVRQILFTCLPVQEVEQVEEQAGVLEPVRSRLWQRVPTIGGDIWAVGGKGGNITGNLPSSGGSGSGGAIFLKSTKHGHSIGSYHMCERGCGSNRSLVMQIIRLMVAKLGGAAGGGGRIYLEASQSLINHTSSTHSNLTASGGLSHRERDGTDGTVRIIRPQVSSLLLLQVPYN